jgi:hypothetical protein
MSTPKISLISSGSRTALLPNLKFFLFALGTKADLPTIEPFSSYHAASDNDRKTAQQPLGSIFPNIVPKPCNDGVSIFRRILKRK